MFSTRGHRARTHCANLKQHTGDLGRFRPRLEVLEDRTVPSSTTLFPGNNGFEVPNQGTGSGAFTYNPTGAGWTFTGGTGVAANGSAFGVQNATNGNSDGTTSAAGQAGFIQGGDGTLTGSAITQTLSGFTSGVAFVTFSIELRGNNGNNNPIDVKLDGQDLGTYLATSTSSFNTVVTPAVGVTAGSHTLAFIGTNPQGGDNTQFIDNVQVTDVSAGVSVVGTELFVVGANTNDHVNIRPIGTSNTGSTGVAVQGRLGGVSVNTTFTQSFTAIRIFGFGGNDTVRVGEHVTIPTFVTEGNGNDHLDLGTGNNTVVLGNGNDHVETGNGTDVITAGNGNDHFQLGDGNKTVTAGNGNDHVRTGTGTDLIQLGKGNDDVHLGGGNNTVILGNGNDDVHVGSGNNTITAGNGNDHIVAGNGNNIITAGNGNDHVVAGNGNNTITLGNGNNDVRVGNGDNTITLGSGKNHVHEGSGHNMITGLHVRIDHDEDD
jgi:hypothetical protein